MTRASRHDILFEPLQIGSKVFRNRFYSVPHASFHVGRRMSDVGFRRMKAEGGWAAVCGGVVSLRDDSWGGFVPRLWDEDDRAAIGRIATEVQGQGALAGIELGHGGAMGEGAKFTPSLGASQLADPDRGRLVPKEMDLDDIRRLQDDWVASAITAADLGYDIVYAYRRARLRARPVPVAMVQPSHRRVRRFAREPGSLLSGDDRALSGSDRRSLPDCCTHRGRELCPARCVGRRDAAVHPDGRRVRRPVGRERRTRLGARLGRMAGRVRGLPGRVVGQGALGDIEADRRRQPADDTGCDGRDPAFGRVGLHRRGAARHRRSLPAAQDRGGPL